MSITSVMYYRDRNWDGFFNSPEYAKVADMEGGISTMDMYDSPYFGQLTSGSFGQAMDLAFEDFQLRIQNQPETGPIFMPSPGTPVKPSIMAPLLLIGAFLFMG